MDSSQIPDPQASLLSRLPDVARWVEARSMLLSKACTVANFTADPLFAVIHYHRSPTTVAVGRLPSDPANPEIPGNHEILVQLGDYHSWQHVLEGRPSELAILYQLPGDRDLPPITHEVRLVNAAQLATDSQLPRQLREELPASWSPVATTWLDDRPVSFCYAASETESLWDVSIDTLPEYRRRGAAASCCARLIDWMRINREKEPVWGALESNVASQALARRLGFRPVDQIWVFGASGSTFQDD